MQSTYQRIQSEELTYEELCRLTILLNSAAIERTVGYGRVWPLYSLARDSFGTVYVSLERNNVMFYCAAL